MAHKLSNSNHIVTVVDVKPERGLCMLSGYRVTFQDMRTGKKEEISLSLGEMRDIQTFVGVKAPALCVRKEIVLQRKSDALPIPTITAADVLEYVRNWTTAADHFIGVGALKLTT